MPVERLAPQTLLESTNLSGAVTDIDDDPDSPDANWLTATDDKSDSICRVSFPTPSGNPNTGAGLQEFRFQIRESNTGGSNVPWSMHLYEGGSDLGEIASGTLTNGAVVVSGTWDASLLTNADGSGVEARIVFTGQGGSPNSRNTGEVGAVEWNADAAEPSATVDLAATLPSLSASADVGVTVQADLGASLPALTAAFDAGVAVAGDLAATLPAITAAFDVSAINARTVDLAATLPALTASADARVVVAGDLAVTLPALTGSFDAKAVAGVDLPLVLPALTGAADASVLVAGDLSATLPAVMAAMDIGEAGTWEPHTHRQLMGVG